MSDAPEESDKSMMNVVQRFEHFITIVLLVMMMLAILVATVDLGIRVVQMMLSRPFMLLEVTEVSSVFGFVFMVLIGLELLETIKTYLSSEQLHVEVVFLVAMIAIARKVILLDIKHLEAPILYGIAAIILALAVGFFFLRWAYRHGENVRNPSDALENDKVD